MANSRDILVKLKASELAYDYYDGKRIYGYGGFRYDGRWKKFLPYIIKKYKLNKNSKVLDIGCKKGFFIKDLKDLVPGIKVFGVEDHRYPIDKSRPSVRKNIKFVNRYYELNFKRNYFDFVIAHNSIYKYNLIDLMQTLRAIQLEKKAILRYQYIKTKRKGFCLINSLCWQLLFCQKKIG